MQLHQKRVFLFLERLHNYIHSQKSVIHLIFAELWKTRILVSFKENNNTELYKLILKKHFKRFIFCYLFQKDVSG